MKIIKKLLIFIMSVLVIVICYFAVQRLVMPKYAGDITEGNFTAEYYKETTEHDVIIIGDCEVYENINPMYLWSNYGITSYIRGNAQQLTWQSYYILEDTLRYETPEVVIYNIQALTHSEPQREEYNRMTLDGMKWSKTKWDAINVSMCKGEQILDYVFPLLRYHSRIFELSKEDFMYFNKTKKSTHNGYYLRVDVLPVSQSDVADPTWLLGDGEDEELEEEEEDIFDPWAEIEVEEDEETVHLPIADGNEDKTFGELPMKYLDKIRELCVQNNIKLILMKAPSLAPQWYEEENQQVLDYAEKYNLPYINFYELLDQVNIDYETDTYDGGLHMNLSGADKLSEYIGNLLVTEYGIKDHRQEEKFSSVYNDKYNYFTKMKQKQLDDIEKYGEIRY